MTTLARPATPEDIAALIATLPTGILADGHWQDGATGRTFAVQNPADRTILTHVADGDATDAMMAITAADRAQSAWAHTIPREADALPNGARRTVVRFNSTTTPWLTGRCARSSTHGRLRRFCRPLTAATRSAPTASAR
jgi:hypothetical protein